ncbi:MAG: four helix bundle protein [Isosphaera sp.]|nr:four helix bundle protein [Isosphaera sp.]
MAKSNFQQLRVYQRAEQLADAIWEIVRPWPNFERDTIGKQLVRAAGSVGANIAEGHGRGSYQENRRFVKIARGSLNETQHWLRRAFARKLLTTDQVAALKPLLDELAPSSNEYLHRIGEQNDRVPVADPPPKG